MESKCLKAKDKLLGKLDCAVTAHLHAGMEDSGNEPFGSVRSLIVEGRAI